MAPGGMMMMGPGGPMMASMMMSQGWPMGPFPAGMGAAPPGQPGYMAAVPPPAAKPAVQPAEEDAALRRERAELDALRMKLDQPSTSVRHDQELEDLKRKIDEQQRQLDSASKSLAQPSAAQEHLAAVQEQRARMEAAYDPSRMDKAKQDLRAAEERLRRRRYGIDLVILMDCTDSMDPFVRQTRAAVDKIFAEARQLADGSTSAGGDRGIVRFAFVGYRDHQGSGPRFEVQDFTEDAGTMKRFVDRVEAKGGDDWPEDVVGGLLQLRALSWEGSTRVVVHVADAPCHGLR